MVDEVFVFFRLPFDFLRTRLPFIRRVRFDIIIIVRLFPVIFRVLRILWFSHSRSHSLLFVVVLFTVKSNYIIVQRRRKNVFFFEENENEMKRMSKYGSGMKQ